MTTNTTLEKKFAPKITFTKNGGFTVESVSPLEAVLQHLKIRNHDGLIVQAWYDDIELPVEQQPAHEQTIAHLTEVIDVRFSYVEDGNVRMDVFLRLSPAYLARRRKAHEQAQWLKRVNPTLYRLWIKRKKREQARNK